MDVGTSGAYAYPIMALRTTAIERAEQLGWSIHDLARRSGLSVETLYKLRDGTRSPGPKTIEALLQAFPNLSYRDLFVPEKRTQVQDNDMQVQGAPAA